MKTAYTTEELLDEIKKCASFYYISDLRFAKFDIPSQNYIKAIPDGKYDLSTWNKAAKYILDYDCNFKDINHVKDILIQNSSFSRTGG